MRMARTYTNVLLHVVFSTKDRMPMIKEPMKSRLHGYLGGVVREQGGKALTINGTADHVHMLLSLPATVSIADLMRLIKTLSSKWVHETFPDQSKFSWQPGYGAFSVSHSNSAAVSAYIQTQEEHHKKVSFRDEFLSLLKRNEIEFDERYLWE